MKGKFWLILLVGLGLFLFLVIKFGQIEKAEFIKKFDNSQLIEVKRVVDGDTIEVKIGDKIESVRLIGIDTPELTDSSTKGLKAIEAKEKLEEILKDKKVVLKSDESQNNRDVYNRLLRYVFLENGIFVNREMIKSGLAEEYTFIVPYKYQEEFRKLEKGQ
ncbi:MAG: thermonuclease family protein [Candidatus Shapirobacteria bacterium]|nr:thermonuclease family protein [Candidatus Shapirobacteria bacterium]